MSALEKSLDSSTAASIQGETERHSHKALPTSCLERNPQTFLINYFMLFYESLKFVQIRSFVQSLSFDTFTVFSNQNYLGNIFFYLDCLY